MELKDSVRVMTKEEFESAINEDIKFVEGIKHFFKHDDATRVMEHIKSVLEASVDYHYPNHPEPEAEPGDMGDCGMSLFVCSKCGCIDNTATSYYWALIRPCKNRIYDKSLKGYEGKPLCSECAAIEYSKGGEVVVVPGTWHGKFKKEWPTEEEKKHIGKNGILNL